jgi:PhnB protein
MELRAHVAFNGQCEEAFKFYEQHLGAKIDRMMRYEGTPAAGQAPAEWKNKILHGRIAIGDSLMMGADAPPGRYEAPKGLTMSLGVKGAAEAERLFTVLSEKGTVQMPLQEAFFAVRFGMVVDRFGVPWMVVCEKTG